MKRSKEDYDFVPKVHIKRRLGIGIGIGIILLSVLLILYGIFKYNLETMLEKEADAYLTEISDSNAEALQSKIEGDINILKGLAVMLGQLDEIDVDKWIEIFDKEPLFEEFTRIAFVFDQKGYSTDFYGIDFSDREYVERGMKGETYISDILNDRVTQKPMVIYIVPIYKGGAVIGLIGFGIFVEEYQKVMGITAFGGKGYSYVVDRTGKAVVYSNHPDSAKGFENIFDILDLEDEQIALMKQYMLEGQDGKISFQSEDGIEKRMLYKKLTSKDWYLLTVIPDEITVQKSNAIQWLMVVFSGTIVIIFLSVLLYESTQQRKHRKELAVLAYVDELTGCANINSFKYNATNLIRSGRHQYAFVALDVDRFKLINDMFGYSQGDLILTHIAQTLKAHVGRNEAFGRVSADNFCILLEYREILPFTMRIKQIVEDIVSYRVALDLNFRLVVKTGIYVINNVDLSIDTIRDRANLALEKIESSRSSGYYFYNDDIRKKIIEENEIEQAMESALENREFQVFLQPKMDLVTEKVSGAEALIRWQHPKKGLLSPGVFIPIFETNGFVTQLDMFVLEEVLKTQKKWLDQGKKVVPISVNQSRLHIYNPSYIAQLKNLQDRYQVPPELIELELTESIFSSEIEVLKEITKEIHDIGYKLSIDDFGSGYSSLNMLKDIKVDTLKLDREFIRETSDSIRVTKIVESVVAMSKNLGIKTLAEGVENEIQVQLLRKIGCEYAQGYYFAKPMPIPEYEKIEI